MEPAADTVGQDRDVRAMSYMPLVRIVASSVHNIHRFNGVPFEEYIQFGMEGLLQAMDRYDPSLGARFETYASYRIRGAILSGLEKSTEVNQQVATLRRLRDDRLGSLVDGARDAGAEQVDAAFARLVDVSVGLAVAFMLDDTALYIHDDIPHWDDGAANLSFKQLQRRLLAALDTLTDKERMIIDGHYFDHQNFEQLAVALALSKGRISQLHRQALEKLRDSLDTPTLNNLMG